MSLKEIAELTAARRFAAITSNPEADDLYWAATCEKWINREYEPAALLLEAAEILRSGNRLPSPLANWLADAFEAAMLKPVENQANELAIELGLAHRGKPRVKLPHGRLLRLLGSRGKTMKQLAKQFKVGKTTIADRMKEGIVSPRETEAIATGVAIAERVRKPHLLSEQ